MKIALVVTGGLHPSGRNEVVPSLLWLLGRLSAQQHDVHAIVLRHLPKATTYTLCGATVHDVGRPRGWRRQWRAVARVLRARGPFDVIHGYWVDPAGLMAAAAGARFRVPSVVTCDSGEFVSLPDIGYGLQRTWKGRTAVSLSCRLATRVHVTSRYMQQLARGHGIDAVCIPFGVEGLHDAAPGETPAGPPWRLLQVASLNPVKDQTTLLEALAIVRRTHDATLDLVGEDTMGGRLQRYAASIGVAGAVAFRGVLPHDVLHAFHRAAHVYVQSSLHEAAGVAVLEAAAAALPIVGTRVGYVSDWEGRGAVAVAPGDARALATAIVRMLDDPGSRAKAGALAHARAREDSPGGQVDRIVALYQSIRRKR